MTIDKSTMLTQESRIFMSGYDSIEVLARDLSAFITTVCYQKYQKACKKLEMLHVDRYSAVILHNSSEIIYLVGENTSRLDKPYECSLKHFASDFSTDHPRNTITFASTESENLYTIMRNKFQPRSQPKEEKKTESKEEKKN